MPVLDRKWWALIAVCTATFMLLLDITVVNVALPSIQSSLHSSFSDLQWVVDAYSLSLAAFLLTAGVVGDMFGRREVFAIGLGVFSVSSLICGLSTSSLMLNLARGAQGVGGAIMFATSLALIASAFHGRERGTAFGIYGAVTGGAVAVGPLIGGALTSGLGWRWIFFVNVPIGAVAIVITLTRVQESKDPNERRIDWIGFFTFSVGLFLFVLALVRGNADGWGSTLIVGLLVAAGVLFVAFLVAEVRQAEPMLDLGLFRRPAMTGVSLTAFGLSASIFAMFLYITLFFQDDLGYGPLAAGIRFLPITMLAFAIAPMAGKLSVRIQARYLLGVGMVFIAVGQLLMAMVHSASGWTVMLPGFIVSGIGIGMVNPVLASSAISVVPPQRSGMASGTNSTFRQVGIATGIAGLGAVFQSQIVQKTVAALSATSAGREVITRGGSGLNQALAGGGVREVATTVHSAPARSALLLAYRGAFASTLDHLMIIGFVISAIGAICAFTLIRQRDFVPSHSPAGAAAGAGDGAAGGTAGATASDEASPGASSPTPAPAAP